MPRMPSTMISSTSVCATVAISIALLFFSLVFFVAFNKTKDHGLRTRQPRQPTHLLIVLGSGGHTEEMLSMLRRSELDTKTYSQRTYIVSSGDAFSARKATEFEQEIQRRETETAAGKELEPDKLAPMDGICSSSILSSYVVVTVSRARKVHQSFLTTPFSTLRCLWECLHILQGRHPAQIRTLRPLLTSNVGRKGEHGAYSLAPMTSAVEYPGVILTNGPGTAVCVVVAAHLLRILNDFLPIICLRFLGIRPRQDPNSMSILNTRYLRTIFVESWARVTTLSLSGRIVLPLVDRFLVQWEPLDGYSSWLGGSAEYAGTLVC